jgi:hypothetical protein
VAPGPVATELFLTNSCRFQRRKSYLGTLINIKKLSYDDALNIINSWLSKCGKQLDQNFDYMVGYALKNGYRSLKLETLKMKNRMLEHVHRHRQYVSLQRLEAGKSQTLYLAHIVEGR